MKRSYLLILFILVYTFVFSSISISQDYSTNFSTEKIEDYYKGLPVLDFESTEKVYQLIGNLDFQTGTDTKNLTQNRYTLTGTDLGYSFEYDNIIIFLFGDAINNASTLGGDCIGYSTTKDPESPNGLRLDFFTKKKLPTGKALNTDNKLSKISTPEPYLKVLPDSIIMAGFEVPCGGISVKGKPFIFCTMDNRNAKGKKTGGRKTYLVRFFPKRHGTDNERFVRKGIISALDKKNSGRFMNIAAHLTTGNLEGLPSNKEQVLLWGTGLPRKSNAYLASITVKDFMDLAKSKGDLLGSGKVKYFAGWTDKGQIYWRPNELDAAPLFYDYYAKKKIFWNNGKLKRTLNSIKKINKGKAVTQVNPMMGDISVTWNKTLDIWLMTYDTRPDGKTKGKRGVMFRYAKYPWGPWSKPQMIFKREKGFNKFIHKQINTSLSPSQDPYPNLAGPMIGNKNQGNENYISGGAYAPYVIERFTKVEKGYMTIYYVLSTWNPYTIVLMKSRFKVVKP